MLTSPRGFPLGEHRRLGPCDEALYGELVHVPLLIRFPDGLGAAARSQALVEPSDLWATLLDCWRIAGVPRLAHGRQPHAARARRGRRGAGPAGAGRPGAPSGRSARPPGISAPAGSAPELFVKPDDRWEVNNVAVRCLEVVECLQDALVQYEQTVQAGRIARSCRHWQTCWSTGW